MKKKIIPRRNTRKPIKNSRISSQRKQTLWDQASRWYDSLVGMSGSDYHQTIVMPGVLKMLELKPGRRVLDLACGQGVFSRFLLGKKIKPEGLDSSEELLRMARAHSVKPSTYHLGNAGDGKLLGGQHFDGSDCLHAA